MDSDGHGSHWEERTSGLHVGKEEKGPDGCNGGVVPVATFPHGVTLPERKVPRSHVLNFHNSTVTPN